MNIRRVIEIDFRRCFKGLLKGKMFIFLFAILGGIVGVIAALYIIDDENNYEATASVYSIAYGSYTESEQGLSAIRTYSDIIKSYRVSERAALLLGDSTVTKEVVYDMISVDPLIIEGTTYLYENNSSVINIHADSEDADKAVRVVNAVADAFVLEINSLSAIPSTQVLDYAYDTKTIYNAPKMQAIVIACGMAGGILLGCLIILYRIIFTSKIVSVNDASMHGQLEIIGAIPRF